MSGYIITKAGVRIRDFSSSCVVCGAKRVVGPHFPSKRYLGRREGHVVVS